eukprot:TRINITY_DN63258_c0_g1_i1.p1 TRINITY_DN63258_c0_g1~~TRINITY_DN63258_c0_g1_i1.p1  ORF type:complete len:164 (+),score=33.02 TRINITY_DN63258_c0_g1_i1:35-526(+)
MLHRAARAVSSSRSRCHMLPVALWTAPAYGTGKQFAARYSSGESSAGGSEAPSNNSSCSEEEVSGGLFCDAWWPEVADRCFKQLATRPQGLPEDPMAQGILAWVEYELARGEAKPGEAATAKKDEVPLSQRDEPPTPLPEDGEWAWLLRNSGEMVGPKGDRGL